MSNNWINEQMKYNVAQWDKTMYEVDPSAKTWNQIPEQYFKRVCEDCNFLESIKIIDWNKYIKKDSLVLDLGCGGGWLSAYLSKFENVTSILAVDTSKNYLFNIMPKVIKIMNGISNKINPIEGMFSPLLIEENYLDMVVASAAVHHADNLESLFKEINLKMKMGGGTYAIK